MFFFYFERFLFDEWWNSCMVVVWNQLSITRCSSRDLILRLCSQMWTSCREFGTFSFSIVPNQLPRTRPTVQFLVNTRYITLTCLTRLIITVYQLTTAVHTSSCTGGLRAFVGFGILLKTRVFDGFCYRHVTRTSSFTFSSTTGHWTRWPNCPCRRWPTPFFSTIHINHTFKCPSFFCYYS